LKLAAPQVSYLYIGCVTLLVRLPFSLCIPHFVSTTLGALSQGQFDRARREIFWLFLLGTIDALLDFWCIFWFGYANLRIVRGVRIDTFASILRQEMGFFDKHTSGELASRLNSDCGAMASGKKKIERGGVMLLTMLSRDQH
jgi:ATP-binding cassette subfamily B (MDR/TAP) protein 9